MNKLAASSFAAILPAVLALGLGLPQSKDPDAAVRLPQLEAALAADPDNLRAGNDYRMAVIASDQYERSIKFFGKLVADHPNSSNAYLNYAFANVDRIPAAGSITQLILANNSLTLFSKSIELKPSWIGYFARGKSYLYWPPIFERTKLGVADLEAAMKIQNADKKHSYHVYTYIFLGDGYWKLGNPDKARAVWNAGMVEFPDNAQLQARRSRQGDELNALISDSLDYTKRVDTNLEELWGPS